MQNVHFPHSTDMHNCLKRLNAGAKQQQKPERQSDKGMVAEGASICPSLF